ncbi:alpha/beta hydrolase [Thioalkalicoccus limnaeus]|uniref:Alpha/beta hydrolase n=1 Tax=Thioalkalicoccus limnaeus TaxID=120681 RepID=A0ABV4BE16_9GAMM
MLARVLCAVALCLVLVSCARGLVGDRIVPGSAIPERYAASASRSIQVDLGDIRSITGCRVEYLSYRPLSAAVDSDPLVVLAHGFLRSHEHMDGLAQRIAAAGYRTASVRFCNSRIWAGRHRENGQDLVRVADVLAAQEVVYVGFSAGGLSALVAGRQDPRTRGIVALDLVDRDGLGFAVASDLEPPVVGLFGDPSPCNAENNGLAVLESHPGARVQRIPGASHCDFETPSDWLCRLVCGKDVGSGQRRQTIIAATTDAVAALLAHRGD